MSNFMIDYADCTDYQDYFKNNSINDYGDYTYYQDQLKNCFIIDSGEYADIFTTPIFNST